MIFKNENMKNYIYILDDTQLMLINKINELREKNNIPKLKYDKKKNIYLNVQTIIIQLNILHLKVKKISMMKKL